MIGKHLRTSGRVIGIAWVITTAALDYCFNVWCRGKSSDLTARASWMCRQSRRFLAALNIQVQRRGGLPPGGMLVTNHLGYVDIIVLGAAQPMVFLSKSEVRNWPVFGPLTACAGTLFIRRDRRSDVARFDEEFAAVVNQGLLLGIFPEGTSSDGHQVLPFHSSLFAPAAAAGWTVSPAWIAYAVPQGTAETDVCYWGDMTFFPHFLRLLTLEKITATVVYGSPAPGGLDRKQMARLLHTQVCELAAKRRSPIDCRHKCQP
jgi:1-acyl-sn-glycerol-3-phosphate acyltransferase